MKRLNRLAIELNVSVETLIGEMKKHKDIAFNAHSKLDQKEMDYLMDKFKSDRAKKIVADEKRKRFYHEIDENFLFSEQEMVMHESLYKEHEKAFREIKQLEKKENEYQVLEPDKIDALLKVKYSQVESIQREIKNLRSKKRKR